jgi:hypothetical protein
MRHSLIIVAGAKLRPIWLTNGKFAASAAAIRQLPDWHHVRVIKAAAPSVIPFCNECRHKS